ncbi:MAG: hypothetical protein ABI162_08205 [Luteolibacter sp.]
MKFLTTDYPPEGTAGHYRIDSDRRMRIEEYQGKVGLGDMKSIMAAMVSDPCWSPDFNGLIDFSEAELEMSSNDVLRLGLLLRQGENRSSGWLVFVTSNSTVYGMVRMLGCWSRNTERQRIFNNRAEAERWLGRNIDLAPPNFREVESTEAPAALRNVS